LVIFSDGIVCVVSIEMRALTVIWDSHNPWQRPAVCYRPAPPIPGHDTAPVHPSTRTAPTRYNIDSPCGTCPPPVPDPYSQAHRLQLVGNRTLIKATGAPGKARDATAENKWAGTPVHVKCLQRTRTVPAHYP